MTERWRIGDRIQDRYEIHDIKGGPGKSGMGIVYICYDHESKVPVALKTFQEVFLSSKKARDDFTKEALTWVNLDRHKNIVRAHYADVIEGRPYIFLEYVPGGSLDDWIGTKMLDLSLALKFAVEFCNGMEFAHKKLGLVHRDVKPSNILITHDETVKVTDFGLAKAVDAKWLESPAVPSHDTTFLQSRPAGTCCWMAPEQWTGRGIDTRVDIYAFGIVLYQMITGGYPYPLQSNWFRIHLKESPQPIKQGISRELNGLVFKCLEKEPDRRYQNFSELKEELLEIYYRLTGERIVLEETPEVLEAWELVNKGGAMEALERHQEAIDCCDKALEINPRHAGAWNTKGVALGYLGRPQEAISCHDKALEINPKYARALYNKGLVLGRNLGKLHDALAYFDKALELNPRYAKAWGERGVTLGNLGRYLEEIACYDKALEINPRDVDAWYNKGATLGNLGRHLEEIACCDKALEINPIDVDAWYNKGLALAALERHQEAIDCFDNALEINPRHPGAWNNKGAALANLGRYQEAMNSYEKFIGLAPPQYAALVKGAEGSIRQLKRRIQGEAHSEGVVEDATPPKLEVEEFVSKGISLANLERYQEAIDCYDKSLEMDLRYAEAWYNKGVALGELGRSLEAIACYDKALEINQRDVRALINKGNILGDLGRYQEAISCYDKVLEINPREAEAWYNKGVALRNLGRPPDEITCYDKALEINPKDADAWYNKGVALANLEKYHEAMPCYDKVLEINPRYVEAWNNKGAALANLGIPQEAIACCDKALEINPRHAGALNNKGAALVSLRRYQEAIETLQNFIEFAPPQYATIVKGAEETIRQLRNKI